MNWLVENPVGEIGHYFLADHQEQVDRDQEGSHSNVYQPHCLVSYGNKMMAWQVVQV